MQQKYKWLISTALLSVLAAQNVQTLTANASHRFGYHHTSHNPKGWPSSWGDFWGDDFGFSTGSSNDDNQPDNVIVYGNNVNYGNTATSVQTSGSDTSSTSTSSSSASISSTSSSSSSSASSSSSSSSSSRSASSNATSTATSSSASQAASQTFSVEGYGNKATGGNKATETNTFYVDSFESLKAALKKKVDGPRKIIITKSIDGNNGQTASDYAKDTGYDFNAYLKAYDPSTYGMKKPSGDQETARAKAQANQGKNVKFDVPDNTTITSTKDVKLTNVNFIVASNNVILQNLDMTAPVDDFPQWDGTDGSTGNWNSQYDAVSLKGGTNVWITHSRFGDGDTNDSKAPTYYGRQYQQHDGLVDITNASDNVTVDYSVFENHDKTMLIGNSDSNKTDQGKLHVTIANNYFHNTTQRGPRVRFGTVNVINNYYQSDNQSPYPFSYAIGAGYKSSILAQNNVVEATKVKSDKFVVNDGEHDFSSIGNVFNGDTLTTSVDKKVKTAANVKVLNADKVKANVLKTSGPQF